MFASGIFLKMCFFAAKWPAQQFDERQAQAEAHGQDRRSCLPSQIQVQLKGQSGYSIDNPACFFRWLLNISLLLFRYLRRIPFVLQRITFT